MKKRPIIIDCDPGIDDSFALFYAFASQDLDVKLVSAVSGNVDIEKTSTNARRVVAMANYDVEVVKGAQRPFVSEPFYADYVHGKNGMGGYEFKEDVMAPLSNKNAIEALRDTILNSKEKITLVAVGPFTNIALLFQMYPEVKENIELISIMGGGLKGGNTTACSEFNVFVDPEAAHIVFESGLPIIMAGLDVTEKAYIDKTHLDRIKNASPIGAFLAEVIKLARQQSDDTFRTSLHDVVSVMVLEHPEIFTGETLNVKVETQGVHTRGMTIADRRLHFREKGNVHVLLDVDHEKFLDELIEKLARYA